MDAIVDVAGAVPGSDCVCGLLPLQFNLLVDVLQQANMMPFPANTCDG